MFFAKIYACSIFCSSHTHSHSYCRGTCFWDILLLLFCQILFIRGPKRAGRMLKELYNIEKANLHFESKYSKQCILTLNNNYLPVLTSKLCKICFICKIYEHKSNNIHFFADISSTSSLSEDCMASTTFNISRYVHFRYVCTQNKRHFRSHWLL